MDDLLRGWISMDLVNIFCKFQICKRKKDIEEIITEWVNKCHRIFWQIWKSRCNAIIEWETVNNITTIEKRKKVD